MFTFHKYSKPGTDQSYQPAERLLPTPMQLAWMKEHAKPGNFAESLYTQFKSKGGLTQKQLDKITESLTPKPPQQAMSVAGAGVEKVEAALKSAKAHGLKKPSLRLGDFMFKLAPDNGKNPGCIYVTEDFTYLGKILHGEFFPTQACDADRKSYIASVCADPEAAAVAYGKLTGNCACCGKALTDPKSVALGIGPVCAKKYGFKAGF